MSESMSLDFDIPTSENVPTPVDTSRILQRRLGDTEISYFLPSRETGANDMYLHLGFHSPPGIMKWSRVSLVWTILRVRHLLLASKVQIHDYDDIRFVHVAPETVRDTKNSADSSLEYCSRSKDEMIEAYLNGPRTLSNERLSYLVISNHSSSSTHAVSEPGVQNFDLILCAAHFLADGMALHQFANEFFSLVSSHRTIEDLEAMLTDEWNLRWGVEKENNCNVYGLPPSLEDRLLRAEDGKLHRVVSRIDFENTQARLIGGHSFPRRYGKPRNTVLHTVSIDSERTQLMLRKCKAKSVSISSALFAVCNIAWARTCDQNWELPTMLYSALNLRSVLTDSKPFNESYWYLAIGYFNIILPTFIPSNRSEEDMEKLFWLRAHSAKNQSTAAAKNSFLRSRSYEMARRRGQLARLWACEDDKADGVWKAPLPPVVPSNVANKPPSVALMGLSLLGDLDRIYKHSAFPNIQLHTLTTGSRQRAGGMLLFGYTFVRKLWISLGYDKAGFDSDTVELFWKHVLITVDTFLG
ncbi:hypothetical protein C8R43DRAFT_1008050 [Mycena crocata]|nr:hypothetical protein C8R43DRAFT_1008050 [Mycena crocata]